MQRQYWSIIKIIQLNYGQLTTKKDIWMNQMESTQKLNLQVIAMDGHLWSCISHRAPDPFMSSWLQEKCWLWSRFHEVVAISWKRRRGPLLHGDIQLLPPLAAWIYREHKSGYARSIKSEQIAGLSQQEWFYYLPLNLLTSKCLCKPEQISSLSYM